MSDDGPDYDTLERLELLADETNDLRELAAEYKAKLRDAEDAHTAFCIQVRQDCENAESAPARIKAALGEYGKDWSGDWLDEACDRLTRKRMLTKEDLAGAVDEMLDRDAPTSEISGHALQHAGRDAEGRMKTAEQILAKLATLQCWAEDGCGDQVVSAYELEAIMQWAQVDGLADAWLEEERARTVRQADCHYGRNRAKFWAELKARRGDER